MGISMKELISIICDPNKTEEVLNQIIYAIQKGKWMQLITPTSQEEIIPIEKLPAGPGFIVNSGGSTGGAHQCLLPCSHLDKSAFASGEWLKAQGVNTRDCQIFNSLPLNHISGLMLWWRSRYWGAQYISINPKLMRNPKKLEKITNSLIEEKTAANITSLVPTQLERLLKHSSGIRWLQSFSLIWIGGSLLSEKLASTARKFHIRLAPCYGATETTAMVTAQKPENFLSGVNTYGNPLVDIELRLNTNKRLEIKTSRLAAGAFINGEFHQIGNNEGWWASGDIAELVDNHIGRQLKVIGRIDTAINSGGETVYPESLQEKLLNATQAAQMPIEEILLVAISDNEWGQRLVALVRTYGQKESINISKLFFDLKELVRRWPPFERPLSWYHCPELKRNRLGKWELSKWKLWIEDNIELSK